MRLIVYALQFQGSATVEGVDGNILRLASQASGGTRPLRVVDGTTSGSSEPELGSEARQESDLTFTGATTFQLVSAIAFRTGAGQVHVHTAGSGYLNPVAEDGCKYGAAVSWVERGNGRFAGASGLITSNFIVTESGEVTDYHLGVVQVR
ncbi:MAG: hypothetical protein H0T93_10120 [Chloroflexia bacterium]|jgi:hypothetical protein|nr:hypothetical protein [Chloroflexia bacterium]